MGNKISKELQVNPREFQEASNQSQHEGEFQTFVVVRNKSNGVLYDRYCLEFLNKQEYEYYLQSINFRRDQQNIVRAFYIVPQHKNKLCSTSYIADVYLQHCMARLSEYNDIPYPDNLYCMMAMLKGYEKLSKKVGGFKISEKQVLIDDKGEVRVWINSDFSSNQPEGHYEQHLGRVGHQSWDNEKCEMVDNIMRIIIDNTDENEGPDIKFRDFYQREKLNCNSKISFQKAMDIIGEYSQYTGMQIPDVFHSVLDHYLREEEISENDLNWDNFDGNHQNYEQQQQDIPQAFVQNSNPFYNAVPQPTTASSNYMTSTHPIHNNPQLFIPHYPTFQPHLQPIHNNRVVNSQMHPINNITQQLPPIQPPHSHSHPHPYPPTNIIIRVPPPPHKITQNPREQHYVPQMPFLEHQEQIIRKRPFEQIRERNHQNPKMMHRKNYDSSEEQKQIEQNMILTGSDNINGIDEMKVIKQLSDFHHMEDKRNLNYEYQTANQYQFRYRGRESMENERRESEGDNRHSMSYQIEKNLRKETFQKQFYYTLNDQIELDPQIAADLRLFTATAV